MVTAPPEVLDDCLAKGPFPTEINVRGRADTVLGGLGDSQKARWVRRIARGDESRERAKQVLHIHG